MTLVQRAHGRDQPDGAAGGLVGRNRMAQGLVTIPRANGEILELRRFGNRWETYSRKPSMWAGWSPPVQLSDDDEWESLARPVQVGGKKIPNPNTGEYGESPEDAEEMLAKGYTHVLWSLGANENHCPQCTYMSRKGLMRIGDLKIEPATGGTFCTDNCTCELVYKRSKTVSVGA